MIEVIKAGEINVVKCHTCESTLRFVEEDVLYHKEQWWVKLFGGLSYCYIHCPTCGRMLYTESVMREETIRAVRKKFSD